jgi:hypothetical protein
MFQSSGCFFEQIEECMNGMRADREKRRRSLHARWAREWGKKETIEKDF